jgi:hypothetical protein
MAEKQPAKPPEPDPTPPPTPEEMLERSRRALRQTPEDWFLERLHLLPDGLKK